MYNFLLLFKQELLLQHRLYQLFKNSFYHCLLFIISFTLMAQHDITNRAQMVVCLFCSLVTILATPHYLVKMDFADGWLDNLLIAVDKPVIVLSKYMALVAVQMASIFALLPFIQLFYQFALAELLVLVILLVLISLPIYALVILINITHVYFRSNTMLLIFLILPLILPILILAGMIITQYSLALIMLMIGINLIMIPLTLVLAGYLLANVY